MPVLEKLCGSIGEGFTVVTLLHQSLEMGRVAVKTGNFPRRLIRGLSFTLLRLEDLGEGTPLSLDYAPSLPLVLLSLKPEVVISTNFNPWTLTSLLMGYPTALFWEGTHHTERTVGPSRMRLRKWIANRAKAFVVNGAMSRRYLIEAVGVDEHKIIEGGMCAMPAPAYVCSDPKGPSPGDRIRFLYVGRMVAGKGVAHLLHAAQLLKRRLANKGQFEVVLLGDGPERSNYEGLAGDLGIDDCVHFVGYVHPDRVWEFYREAHVFVLPTLQDNWPLVVPEAMSAGLPILISRRAGSVPDLVRDGENGYSYEPENREQLALHLEEYVGNPRLARRHGQRSLELVSHYNPERAANSLLWAIAKAREGTQLTRSALHADA